MLYWKNKQEGCCGLMGKQKHRVKPTWHFGVINKNKKGSLQKVCYTLNLLALIGREEDNGMA